MFREIANDEVAATALFEHSPAALGDLLERSWQESSQRSAASSHQGRDLERQSDHLIYAYMIESTRIYEIFGRVLGAFLHGEGLGVPPNAAVHSWLRNTEELFYREPPPLTIGALASKVRPSQGASRRNTYWRLFGMELSHESEVEHASPYVKAEAANTGFVTTFEEFLREAWLGITSGINSAQGNPGDAGKLRELVGALAGMLNARRLNGNLAREEFVFTAMMAWFHVTVLFDTPIVRALQAQSSEPEQRLTSIARRVGLPAHASSNSFFAIAVPMSHLLVAIEAGRDIVPDVLAHPVRGLSNGVQTKLRTIINHWSALTGRDIKAAQPVRGV